MADHKRPVHSANIVGLFIGLSPAERKVGKRPSFLFQRCHISGFGDAHTFDSASRPRARLNRKECEKRHTHQVYLAAS